MSIGELPPDVREGSPRALKPEGSPGWLRDGTVVRGRYELLRYLGSGRVGSVFIARHLGFDERVALKFLQPHVHQRADCAARFMREARAGFRLRSEHVGRVFDVDLHEQIPFIATELLEGSTLRDVLKQRGALPRASAVDYALQICEALASAHALGVLHLGIEPGNVFLLGDEHIKLVDFGISQVLADADDHTTVRYAAPERFRADTAAKVSSDIWSVGCVLYELLSGQAAFQRSSVLGTCAAVLGDEPVAISHVPGALWDVLTRCLQKSPEARFADVSQLAAALAPFGSGRYSAYPERCRTLLSLEQTTPAPRLDQPAAVSVQQTKLLGPSEGEPTEIRKPVSRKETLAFDVSAFASPAEAVRELDASVQDSIITPDEAVSPTPRVTVEQDNPATLEEIVRDMRRPAPARVLLLMAALACMAWSGVALLSAPEKEQPAKLLHLVTPLQK